MLWAGRLFSEVEIEMGNKFWHVTSLESVPSILRNGLIPRIGPRSSEAGETEPGVYLFPTYEAVEDALMNWLGDQFPDDANLVLLRIRLPYDATTWLVVTDADYEVVSREAIPANCIAGVYDEQRRRITALDS